MAYPQEVILTPATGAGQSSSFHVHNRPMTVSIYNAADAGMTAAEYSDLQRKNPAGYWQDVFDSAGQVRLHAGRTEITVIAGGEYRIDKEATTESVGVEVFNAPMGV